MRRSGFIAHSLAWALATLYLPRAACSPRAAECNTVSVRVDPSLATGSGAAILGRAVGQTFRSLTTRIESITVWRVPVQDTLGFGLHLYVCRVDSTGTPLTQSLILDGPTLVVPYGDGVHPIEFRYDFDPPLLLPQLDEYCFFLQTDCDAYTDIMAGPEAYADGSMWLTGSSIALGCILRPGPTDYSCCDLSFDIAFCDWITATKKGTWGWLKILYR